MLFEKQDDAPEKIRVEDPNFGKGFKGFKWIMLRRGSQIDLLEDHGLRLGLIPVNKKELVPDKPVVPEDTVPKVTGEKNLVELFKKELESIKGIGKKTSRDIIKVYPTKEDLIKDLKKGVDVPIRDDLAILIYDAFFKKDFGVK